MTSPVEKAEKKGKILVVDDNDEALFALETLLADAGYEVITATNGKEAFEKAETESPELILLDVVMPLLDGYATTEKIKADPVLKYIPVVLLTSKGDLEDILKGFDAGADDYVIKPYTRDVLLARVTAVMRTRELYRELWEARRSNRELQYQLGERSSFAHIIGKSAGMQEVYSLIEKVADAQAPVLVTGESGTGKELVARALHFQGRRREQAFVVQNCSAFNENLLESELFGHMKGAFTGAIRDKQGLFEAADGGTFFLDELGEMSQALQVKLLRVLQDGTFTPVGGTVTKKVDVRIVAATNRDLREMVAEGTFREDLFYRLHVVSISLPPLRERRVDIPLLLEHFLAAAANKEEGSPKAFTTEALRLLCAYDWPGNIRELQNEIERLVLMVEGQEIGVEHLSPHISGQKKTRSSGEAPEGTLKEAIEALEKRMIAATLDRVQGNKSEAARVLDMSRSSLISKVQAYELE